MEFLHKVLSLYMIIIFGIIIPDFFDSCRPLGRRLQYTPGCHLKRTYTPAKHTLHFWFVPSDMIMSADEANESNGGRWRS